MSRQFVAAEFKPNSRAYTYHNDGEPLAAGDIIRVAGRHGGEQRATVVGISDEPPPFETKPVLGLAPSLETQGENEHGR